MGRYAGYNVISDLLAEPMLPLRIPWYVTVLNLGRAGAVYTGAAAKATKHAINTQRIYPSLTGDKDAPLAAAGSALQGQPKRGH